MSCVAVVQEKAEPADDDIFCNIGSAFPYLLGRRVSFMEHSTIMTLCMLFFCLCTLFFLAAALLKEKIELKGKKSRFRIGLLTSICFLLLFTWLTGHAGGFHAARTVGGAKSLISGGVLSIGSLLVLPAGYCIWKLFSKRSDPDSRPVWLNCGLCWFGLALLIQFIGMVIAAI